MIAGATISVLPMRVFFVAGGLFIAWGCIRELKKGQAAIAVLMVAVTLAVFYREVPKPPTTDQLAGTIAAKLIELQSEPHPKAPHPPTNLKVTFVRRSEAEIVAEKVLALMKGARQ